MAYSQTFPRWYPDCYVVVGLGWSKEPESYAGGSVAAGRACDAGQVEGDNPDERDTLVQVWGWVVRMTTSPHKKKLMFRKPQRCLGED